ELAKREIDPEFAQRLGDVCFRFIEKAARSDGRYHNFSDKDCRWLDSVGSDDSFGRTLWSLAVASAADLPFAPKSRSLPLLECSLPLTRELPYLRSRAFALIAIAQLPGYARDKALELANRIADGYENTRGSEWRWFEDDMTYCNARLPQAMFLAATLFPKEDRFLAIGVESLDFLLKAMRLAGKGAGYAPIGNDGWYKRGQKRPALFDQQPVDAGALVEACMQALQTTGEPRFRKAAHEAFAWYHGENIHGLPIYDPLTGGVCDALIPTGVNCNQGAESVLSYLMAYFALDI
ncbi:MAG TPA: hypothetical protein VFW40_07995, partial [Capsulimonadaceae bacterium]|nr:hypothetical protein [Capsulimonadaceae bacterium]